MFLTRSIGTRQVFHKRSSGCDYSKTLCIKTKGKAATVLEDKEAVPSKIHMVIS